MFGETVVKFDFTKSERIDHRRLPDMPNHIFSSPNDVHMPVKIIHGLERIDQPAEGFDPLVREIILVVHSERWRVGDKKIQETPVNQPVVE